MMGNRINVEIEKARNKKGESVFIQIRLAIYSEKNCTILYDSMIRNNEELVYLPKHIRNEVLLQAPSSITVAKQIRKITKGFIIEKNTDFEHFMKMNTF